MEKLLSWDPSIGMILGLIAISVIMLISIFLVLCNRILAHKNIFFTFGKENCIIYVMTGKKFSGRTIMPSKNLYVDKNDGYKIKKLSDLPTKDRKKFKQFSIWGMYWIGIYPFYSIYGRHQQWLEWESTSDGRKIKFRDEMTPYLIAKPFEYAMLLKEAEDANGAPLTVRFTVIVAPTNADLPIFGNDDAYGQLQTLCIGEALLVVKKTTFSKLGGGNAPGVSNDEFSTQICKINDTIPGRPTGQGTMIVLGYQILDAKLDEVEFAGAQKEKLLQASTAEYLAIEAAKADVAKADGEKRANILRAEGEKIAGMLKIDITQYDMKIRNDFYELIKDKPAALQIELAKKMFEDSKLTHFVSGTNIIPTIDMGGK